MKPFSISSSSGSPAFSGSGSAKKSSSLLEAASLAGGGLAGKDEPPDDVFGSGAVAARGGSKPEVDMSVSHPGALSPLDSREYGGLRTRYTRDDPWYTKMYR